MKLSAVIVYSTLAICQGVLPSSASALTSRSLTGVSVFSRQLSGIPSDIPPSCQSACTPVAQDFATCGDTNLSCLCTDKVVNDLSPCFNCIITAEPSTKDSLSQLAQEAIRECDQAGFSVGGSTAGTTGSTGTSGGSSGGSSSGTGIKSAGAGLSPSQKFPLAVIIGMLALTTLI